MSRRRFAGLLGTAGLAAGGAIGVAACDGTQDPQQGSGPDPGRPGETTPRPDGVLGANFNGDPSTVTFDRLRAIDAYWLRGFCPMPDIEQGDAAQDPSISMLRTAAERGYGTLLSLKFPFAGKPIPRPGSPEMAAELARLDTVLPTVLDKIDILVIGNEPFIESRKQDQDDRLNACYETLAAHVIEHREREFGPNCKTRLFMGALNRLDLPDRRTPATERWMTFVRKTPALDGVDIHPHVPNPAATTKYLDYVLPRLRPDQTFLATEFSLVLYWKKQLSKPVSPEFARRYGFPAGTPVWEVVRAATEQPFSQRQWNDFLAMSPWYEKRKHFLRNQLRLFRETGRLAVATYGIAQDSAMVRDFGSDSMPWLFNSLFASKTVRPGADGLPGRGYGWIEDFRALQRERDKRPVR